MKRIVLLICAALLAACAPSAPPAPASTATPAAPSAAPATAVATPAASTTSEPATSGPATAAPATAGPTAPGGELLPAPLYVLELGQIARIERDGVTRALVTDERVELDGVPPIATFTASSLGTLAYIVSDIETDRLVVADARGENARILYEEQGHELSDLLFAPDGETLLFRLLNNRQPPDLSGGIYQIPVVGGALELLRADDPVADPVNPPREASGYAPLAFSPDGERLLVAVDSLYYEDCAVGVMPAAGGEVVRVTVPADQQLYCGEAVWSADGNALLLTVGPREGLDVGPNLWRADPAAGAVEPMLAPATFIWAPFGMPGGATRFFLAAVERDGAGNIVAASFGPAELGPGAATPAASGELFPERIEQALWAPDGSGAVLELGSETERSLLRWVPFAGAAVELPSAQDGIGDMAWGVP